MEEELINSKKLLDTYTQSMLEKSALLQQFESEIEKLKNLKSKELYEEKIERLNELTKATILTEEDWKKFQELFEQVHKGFFIRLKDKLPHLTHAEIRLLCLTKLKLNPKEMAGILAISSETIIKTRYRLNKKLSLSDEKDIDSIVDLI